MKTLIDALTPPATPDETHVGQSVMNTSGNTITTIRGAMTTATVRPNLPESCVTLHVVPNSFMVGGGLMPTPTGKTTRAERLAQPLAREVAEQVATDHGVCIRPVSLRRTNINTGKTEVIDVPCGSTLESRCPACAKRKRSLRRTQCEEGWHLTTEPVVQPDPPTKQQRAWVEQRAMVTAERDRLAATGQGSAEDLAVLDAAIADLDEEITASGLRGSITRSADTPTSSGPRRVRSTKRRQDVPDLPKRPMTRRTVGRAFTDPNSGKVFRPSLFLTLTLDSYGRVRSDGTPVDPSTYDYRRAARDTLHFSKLIDRFVQNLRRVAGFDVQYFAAVEPQRRLAPHLHMATRGTIPRAELRQIAAATYHQVWWPKADRVVFEGDHLPQWDEAAGTYLDPATGEVLPTWNEALDTLDEDPDAEPFHVVRFGRQVDAKGVVAGSEDANRCVRYLAKYLTKDIADCHTIESVSQEQHLDRLLETLRFEPCSPRCANWLRYGIQPHDPKPGLRPGFCRSKAHRREHLGYAGRRVLVYRKWSGKTLADHKADRLAWVLKTLGIDPADADQADEDNPRPPVLSSVSSGSYAWELARPTDPDVAPREQRLLRAVGEALKRRAQLDAARQNTLSATHEERAA